MEQDRKLFRPAKGEEVRKESRRIAEEAAKSKEEARMRREKFKKFCSKIIKFRRTSLKDVSGDVSKINRLNIFCLLWSWCFFVGSLNPSIRISLQMPMIAFSANRAEKLAQVRDYLQTIQ